MSILNKLVYRVNRISTPANFWRNQQTDFKFLQKLKVSRIAKTILLQKNTVERLIAPTCKAYYLPRIIIYLKFKYTSKTNP